MRGVEEAPRLRRNALGGGLLSEVVRLRVRRFVVDCELESSLCFEQFGVDFPMKGK